MLLSAAPKPVAKVGVQPQHISIPLKDDALVSRAKPRRRFGQRIEHRLQIERGAADDLEHVGGSSLLPQRFGQVACALPQFIEQPRILDGYDGLGSKIAD